VANSASIHELIRDYLADWTALTAERATVVLIGVGTLEAVR
jgi:hypothetical protein